VDSWVTDRQNSIGEIASQANLQEYTSGLIAALPGSSNAGSLHDSLVANLRDWAGAGHQFLSWKCSMQPLAVS